MNKIDQAATSGGNKMAQAFDSTLSKSKSSVQQGWLPFYPLFNNGSEPSRQHFVFCE